MEISPSWLQYWEYEVEVLKGKFAERKECAADPRRGLVSFQCFQQLCIHGESTDDVIVVVAASMGLYATKTLQSLDFEVLLIEATDRVGG